MTRSPMRSRDVAVALWPAFLLIAVGVGGFAALLVAMSDSARLAQLDQPLIEWFAAHRTEGLTTFLTGVSTLFGPVIMPVLVALIAGVWWWRTRSWWHPAVLAGAMLLSTLLTVVLKAAVGRARPEESFMSVPGYETSGSFPSGHTIGAATLVLVLGYLLLHTDEDAGWRTAAWLVLSVGVISLVAISRLYLGYHFLTDVLAGACVAVTVLGVVVGVERWHDLALERRHPTVQPTPLAAEHDDAAEAEAAQED